jgi:predicted outer membrane repeat protein
MKPLIRSTSRVAVLGLLASGLVMIAPSVAGADTIDVTTTADGGAGSLRAAIDEINTAGAGPHTINLVAGETYELTDCDLGYLEVQAGNGPLTINGNGATIDQTCVGERIMRYDAIEQLTFNEVTITGGNRTGSAGAIKSFGPVAVNDSTFVDNTADDDGGAIWTSNQAVTITGSTFTRNQAGRGGAVYSGDSTITVTNSTFEGNTATSDGGALAAQDVDVSYTTFSGNEAGGSGAAIASAGGSVFATVLADAAADSCSSSLSSGGYNWSDDLSCDLNTATDTEDVDGDPGLAGIADNGGPTATMLPETGSPLLDAIPSSVGDCTGTDQRGITRPQNGACDIGAVEVAAATPPTPPTPVDPAAPAAPAAAAAQATPRFTG